MFNNHNVIFHVIDLVDFMEITISFDFRRYGSLQSLRDSS